MANYYDEDACEREADKAPDDVVPIEGRMLLSGTPQKIGVMIAQFLGTERIRCTIEWSADWRGF